MKNKYISFEMIQHGNQEISSHFCLNLNSITSYILTDTSLTITAIGDVNLFWSGELHPTSKRYKQCCELVKILDTLLKPNRINLDVK